MKKIKTFFLNLNYRHYLCVGLSVAFLLISVFVFPYAYPRIGESFRDFGRSFLFMFTDLFGVTPLFEITVTDLSGMPFTISDRIPETWEVFKEKWGVYWDAFATKETFVSYLRSLGSFLNKSSKVLVLILLIGMLLAVLSIPLIRYLKRKNNDYNEDTLPLKVWKKTSDIFYRPVKKWIREFFSFVSAHFYYVLIWAFLWAISFNLVAVVIEFFAFYFYFIVSFDVGNIYIQVYKLLLDLSVMFKFVPVFVWVIVGLIIFDKFRKKRGYANLWHMELMNRGFINERPIVSMVCAKMGMGKTTMLTDMAISTDIMLRDKAYEIILENDLKFPYFPWINFENAVKRAIDNHSIYNLVTARRFVLSKKRKFDKRPVSYYLFGYDYKRYGLTYDNGLFVVDIWDVIYNYVQAYMLYIMSSSFIQSNYSIRTDALLDDVGNFPLWNADFFRRDAKHIDSFSRHAHILDFDALKLGKKLLENNDNDYFEFGVVAITEIGKERGNNLELTDVKKNSDETNQKNDLFNSWLKMIRHSATVDNVPFVKVFVDEQRPSSWGADAKDLSEIIHIDTGSEKRLSMPFFFLEETLHSFLKRLFERFYKTHRYNKGDNTLFCHIFKTIYAKLHSYYVRTYNTFGFKVLGIKIEDGKQDGVYEDKRYFIMDKKIYAKRFSTDCFSEFFEEKVKRSVKGLNDVPEFEKEKASFNEMKSMNSYFFRDLTRIMRKKNNTKRKIVNEEKNRRKI